MTTKTKTATRKATQRAALRARLAAALAAIYGNARTPWADDVPGFAEFGDWLSNYAERERDYMSLENFGMTENETRHARLADGWRTARERLESARRFPSYPGEKATSGAKLNHSFPAGPWERSRAVLILDAADNLVDVRPRNDGKGTRRDAAIYSHGRGGKSVYPDRFASSENRGLVTRDIDEMGAEELTRTAQFIEQFNAHIRDTAKGAAAAYRDEAREQLEGMADDARENIGAWRLDFARLAAELRSLGAVDAPTACQVLRAELTRLARLVRIEARGLAEYRATLRNLSGGAL